MADSSYMQKEDVTDIVAETVRVYSNCWDSTHNITVEEDCEYLVERVTTKAARATLPKNWLNIPVCSLAYYRGV